MFLFNRHTYSRLFLSDTSEYHWFRPLFFDRKDDFEIEKDWSGEVDKEETGLLA
jgi:hypothetical protein